MQLVVYQRPKYLVEAKGFQWLKPKVFTIQHSASAAKFIQKFHPSVYLVQKLNPIPTSQGRNQPLYEHHVTKSGRDRVKEDKIMCKS